jgi:hypothetical protein
MAQQLGLGLMPWSPLRSGFLSGKFSRKRTGAVDALRTSLVGEPAEADYDVIDVLETVAAEAGVPPAAVALSWVHHRPGVTSTLIGARRMDQLTTNLDAIEVRLTESQTEALDKVSTPKLNFPADYAKLALDLAFAGTTVDSVPSEMSPLASRARSATEACSRAREPQALCLPLRRIAVVTGEAAFPVPSAPSRPPGVLAPAEHEARAARSILELFKNLRHTPERANDLGPRVHVARGCSACDASSGSGALRGARPSACRHRLDHRYRP